MEKDNRSKEKRSRNRQFKKRHYQNISQNSSSSASHIQVQGIVDVADSSDDRFSFRSFDWNSNQSDEEPEIEAPDFSLLQNLSTGGDHFTFSSEKSWDADEPVLDKSEASSYFTINLKLLNIGLLTIPFSKRMDYPSSMFDKHDIYRMNSSAELFEKKFEEVLKEHESGAWKKPPSTSMSTQRSQSGKSTKSDVTVKENKINAEAQDKDDELDELLNLTTSNVAKVSFADESATQDTQKIPERITEDKNEDKDKVAEGNAEEIQQWLDKVLE